MNSAPNVGPGSLRISYWKSFLALFAAGMVGVLSLYPTLGPTTEALSSLPGAPPLSPAVLQAVLLVNPTILLLVGVAVGTAVAPPAGLRSHLAEAVSGKGTFFAELRPELKPALLGGVAAGVGMLVLDELSARFLGTPADTLRSIEGGQPRSLTLTLMGMLYGGITEELMMRWGMMALLVWVLWRVVQRGNGRAHTWIGWVAIVAAALLFGAGHLGVVAAQGGITPPLVARTVLVNAVGGVVFGWLFWRYSVEAAMVAHASVHVVFTLVDRTAWWAL